MEGRPKPDNTLLSGVLRAGEWMLLTVAAGALLAGVVVPRLGGGTPYAVLTGSMSPSMPPGTLVIIRDVDPAALRTGDVITFMPRENDTSVITHRVVGVGFDATGEPTFRTKGDANDAPDVQLVHGYQVVGKRWYSVPYLGYVVVAVTAQQRALAIFLAAGALILYMLVMFAGAFRDRVRRPPGMSHA